MTKEELLALGLDEDQIKGVFKLRGLEVEANKQTIADLEKAKKAAEEVADNFQKELDAVRESSISQEDYDLIKQEKEALETEISNLKGTHASEIESVKFNKSLEFALKEAGARNVDFVKSVLNEEELKYEDGKIVGLDEQLEAAKADHGYLFETKGSSTIASSKHKGGSHKISKERFEKMTYSQKVDLYNKDPELYKSLSK